MWDSRIEKEEISADRLPLLGKKISYSHSCVLWTHFLRGKRGAVVGTGKKHDWATRWKEVCSMPPSHPLFIFKSLISFSFKSLLVQSFQPKTIPFLGVTQLAGGSAGWPVRRHGDTEVRGCGLNQWGRGWHRCAGSCRGGWGARWATAKEFPEAVRYHGSPPGNVSAHHHLL